MKSRDKTPRPRKRAAGRNRSRRSPEANGIYGRFQFGALEATMDVRETEKNGKLSIEFTWEGFDEGDEICGRGRAVIDGSSLYGHLCFHLGDDYGFKAKRIGK